MAETLRPNVGSTSGGASVAGACTGNGAIRASGRFEGHAEELLRFLEPAGGEWAVVIDDLDGKGYLAYNAESPFTAASVIKIPIMMAAFHKAREGKIRLDNTVILRNEDKVGGSGVLKEFHAGLVLTLLDCINLMIVVSDNTGTNLTIDAVGIEEINRYMVDKGCKNTRLESHLMRPKPQGPWNKITASDIALLLRGLADRTIENPGDCDTMIEIMKRQQYNHKMPRFLPKEAICAHKTGEVRGVTHDAGIVYGPSARFVIVCLSQKLEDVDLGHTIIGQVTKWAYDVLSD
ncbi:MAG TPA: serine hydrolase [Firmicutes bacterium]|nr:serine hydrolase [Candidatus Fermentithermobacillaceae bacterium]